MEERGIERESVCVCDESAQSGDYAKKENGVSGLNSRTTCMRKKSNNNTTHQVHT